MGCGGSRELDYWHKTENDYKAALLCIRVLFLFQDCRTNECNAYYYSAN